MYHINLGNPNTFPSIMSAIKDTGIISFSSYLFTQPKQKPFYSYTLLILLHHTIAIKFSYLTFIHIYDFKTSSAFYTSSHFTKLFQIQ